METENLIIVREPLATRRAGPYHIQLVKGFAVINHNSAPHFPDYFTGMYRKQHLATNPVTARIRPAP